MDDPCRFCDRTDCPWWAMRDRHGAVAFTPEGNAAAADCAVHAKPPAPDDLRAAIDTLTATMEASARMTPGPFVAFGHGNHDEAVRKVQDDGWPGDPVCFVGHNVHNQENDARGIVALRNSTAAIGVVLAAVPGLVAERDRLRVNADVAAEALVLRGTESIADAANRLRDERDAALVHRRGSDRAATVARAEVAALTAQVEGLTAERDAARVAAARERTRCAEAVGVGLGLCIIAEDGALPAADTLAYARATLGATDEEWVAETRDMIDELESAADACGYHSGHASTIKRRDDAKAAFLAHLGIGAPRDPACVRCSCERDIDGGWETDPLCPLHGAAP